MKAKKGISLIVLVITIIVIIILAAAVLLTLNNNNPIENSKQATFDNDVAEVKSAVTMYISNFMAKNPNHDGPFNPMTENDWIVVGTAKTEAAYATNTKTEGETTTTIPEPKTTYGDGVTWEKLNLTAPASIRLMYFNCETGATIAIPTQTGVKYTYDSVEFTNALNSLTEVQAKYSDLKIYGEE